MKYTGALDKEIRAEYGNEAIVDGIVNMSKYRETYPKILWILKEANWSHHKDCKPAENDYNHRAFLKNVACYDKWKNTFKLVIACSFGIMYKPKEMQMPVVDEEASINGIKVMHNIALINVKKTAGVSASNDAEISEAYKSHRELLLKQIKQINPDVIINCSRVWDLTKELGKGMEKLPIPKGNQARGFYNNEKLVIEYNHPNTRGNQTDKSYYNDIIKCYNKWKELPPIKK